MKYLYLIFKLFKCSHKYQQIDKISEYRRVDNSIVSYTFVNRCIKCGKITSTKVD